MLKAQTHSGRHHGHSGKGAPSVDLHNTFLTPQKADKSLILRAMSRERIDDAAVSDLGVRRQRVFS